MKIKIDIDCTPAEARAFFGLPDLGPMQDAVMKKLQTRMEEAAASFDPGEALKAWFPQGSQMWEEWRKAFGSFSGEPGAKNE